MRTSTQGDLQLEGGAACLAPLVLPHLAGLSAANERQDDEHDTEAVAQLAEPDNTHDTDDSEPDGQPVEVERVRTVLGDDYDPPTVELYPPRVRPELPLPLLRGRHRMTVDRLAAAGTYLVREHTYVPRQRVAPWVLVVLAAAMVVLMLALSVWLAVGVPASVPLPAVEAPTTGPTPSPLGVSVRRDGLAPVVAELLDVHGGGH